ncbi:glycosyltransferase family 9 protein [Gammaproteobacteria bacterium]|nr:glycosyltransferase family 9 protein [Gammaproteobacteria bacterium]
MKILVIRLKQIGDALISLPVCKSLKHAIPDAQIDYLVYEHIGPLFHHHPAIDNVLTITPEERDSPRKYFRKMQAIRQSRYDLVIDLLTVPVTVLMTRYSGARLQLGFDKGKWRSKLYKIPVPHPKSGGSLDAKLSILEGLPFDVERLRGFEVILTDNEIMEMRKRMDDSGLVPHKPILLFSPVSRLSTKNWPEDYFVEIVNYCLENYDVQGVMIWGPGEKSAVDSLARGIKKPDRIATGIETHNLRELAALSRQCTLFIGNDSGPRHVAEATGTPTFTIFSPPISKYAWLPHRGQRHRGVDMCDVLGIDEPTWHKRVPEFQREMEAYYRRITPDLVIDKLNPMLKELLTPLDC